MKILLVKPDTHYSDHIQPPLGLGYIASALEGSHEVSILDLARSHSKNRNYGNILKKTAPDVVGFQCYTGNSPVVKRLASLTKELFPRAVTVAGGPQPTLLPEDTFRYMQPGIDYLIAGEGEKCFPLFLRMLKNEVSEEEVCSLVWRAGDSIHRNRPVLTEDLDTLDFPSWEKIKPHEYPPAQHGAFYKNFPIAPIITTRGCPFRCNFCSAPAISGTRLRKRSADNVIEEIRLLNLKFGIREIHIIDDNFSIDKEHARSVLEKIIASGLDISIAFPNGLRIETLDDEILRLMKKSGCYLISTGIESGSDRTLKRMRKGLTLEIIRERISLIKKSGFDIAGFFIIGYPGETVEDINKTIRFSMELGIMRANFFSFLPMPGTPVYEQLGKKKRPGFGSRFFFASPQYSPEGISSKKLKNIQRVAFARFYLRPRILFKNIMQVRSPAHLKYLLKRFYNWIIA